MKLFWHPNTRAVRALWLLEESGLDYEPVIIKIGEPDAPRDPDFLKASPMGKVPAFADGDVFLSDSAAIALYVADKYPQTELAPAINDPSRATYLYWMIYTPGVIEPAMTEKVGGWPANKTRSGWGDFDLMIKTLAEGIGDGPWILGEQFTAADVMCGSSANFMRQFGLLPEIPVLEAYASRCAERPAYQRSQEINATAAGNS